MARAAKTWDAFLAKLEDTLAASLPEPSSTHGRLRAAMAHSLLGGGKRLRPRLLAACARLGEHDEEAVLLAGAALEMLHCYSLIHDDLPAMDDDDWRRGRPTCHKAFGEAMAILAGDALQALAFETLAKGLERSSLPTGEVLAATADFARAAGAEGMVAGQAGDLEPARDGEPAEQLLWIHERKTAALIRVALTLGARLGGLTREERVDLERAGALLGLAFQTVDDLLDARSSREELGKTPGKDEAQGKLTMLALHGEERAAAMAEGYLQDAIALIPARPAADELRDLARALVHRSA